MKDVRQATIIGKIEVWLFDEKLEVHILKSKKVATIGRFFADQ